MSVPSDYIPEYGYIAVIEAPDNTTFEQAYPSFEGLLELVEALGEGYRIVCIY